MVQNVLIFIRKIFHYEHIITLKTLERMNQVILLTGSMVGYAYAIEFFMGWYSGNPTELFVAINRAIGTYAWGYWLMVTCNLILPQLFWIKKIRRSIPVMFTIAVFVNVGMWFERFIIIVTSLTRDFLPSSWHVFIPTIYDIGILIGSFGFFFTWILLFTKALPVVSIAEVKAVVEGAQPSHAEVKQEV
jgi:molybdopterin-containing oxidoreductase family membrane subunit